MEFEDLFELPPYNDEFTPELTADEFISKTKSMLTLIEREYSQNWRSRRLTDSEYEKCDCDNCKTGSCTLNIEGIDFDVVADNEQGDCFVRIFDHQAFSEYICKTEVFGNDTFFELYTCRIVPDVSAEPETRTTTA